MGADVNLWLARIETSSASAKFALPCIWAHRMVRPFHLRRPPSRGRGSLRRSPHDPQQFGDLLLAPRTLGSRRSLNGRRGRGAIDSTASRPDRSFGSGARSVVASSSSLTARRYPLARAAGAAVGEGFITPSHQREPCRFYAAISRRRPRAWAVGGDALVRFSPATVRGYAYDVEVSAGGLARAMIRPGVPLSPCRSWGTRGCLRVGRPGRGRLRCAPLGRGQSVGRVR